MIKKLSFIYLHHKSTRGYSGWVSNYCVADVIDLETGEKLASFYEFKNTKIFKGKRFKDGDKIEGTFTVTYEDGNLKLSYPFEVKKVE